MKPAIRQHEDGSITIDPKQVLKFGTIKRDKAGEIVLNNWHFAAPRMP